jgi:hypothetical protein
MKIIPDHKHIPFGPYVGKMKVDPDFCKRLLELGKTLTKRHNEYLAGNIYHEYVYDLKKHRWLEEEFEICVNTWIAGFRQFSGDVKFDPKYKLHPLWINFQKAGEYNPVHTHPNCNLSFILFLEIPKEMLEEKPTSKGAPPGHTGFLYGEDIYGVITHRIVKPEEGTLYMFPSNLRHYVSHFNSKVTRTSVSGNVTFF